MRKEFEVRRSKFEDGGARLAATRRGARPSPDRVSPHAAERPVGVAPESATGNAPTHTKAQCPEATRSPAGRG